MRQVCWRGDTNSGVLGVALFPCQAPFLGLFLQDIAREQLALGIGHGFEFRAHVKTCALGIAMGDPRAQQQAERLGHQHQLDRQVRAGRQGRGVLEVDAAFGNDHRLRRADFIQQAARHDLAEQVQAFVLHAQEGGEGAVFLAELA